MKGPRFLIEGFQDSEITGEVGRLMLDKIPFPIFPNFPVSNHSKVLPV